MKKVAIVTDSSSYIPEEVRKRHHIHMVPLAVIFENDAFKEEAELSATDFYNRLRQENKLPSTSQPAIGDFVALFEKLAMNHDEAIVITISGSLSGTNRVAESAGKMVDGLNVHVFDTEIACMAEGFYALEAARLAEEGKTVDEILDRLYAMRENGMKAYLMVDDLTNLHRGGRLTGAQYIVGSLLKVKPILTFKDKKIVPYETIRTRKKALQRIMELFGEDAMTGEPVRAAVIHANRVQEAEEMAKSINQEYLNVDVSISYFGAVIGTHAGEGALGIGWYKP